MKQVVLIFIISLFTPILYAQSNFPDNWVGQYEGVLNVYQEDGLSMQFEMMLNVSKDKSIDSVYNWQITYSVKGENSVKEYKLKEKDRAKGHYLLDEENSIVLDFFKNRHTLIYMFQVDKSIVFAQYTKVENEIHFNLVSSASNVTITGNQDEIGEVSSYPILGRQSAILYKTK